MRIISLRPHRRARFHLDGRGHGREAGLAIDGVAVTSVNSLLARGRATAKTQAVTALGLSESPIESVPGEVIALVFCFVDAKTLMVTIPKV